MSIPPRIYFIGKPFEFELTYVDLHPLERDYIHIRYLDKTKNQEILMDTDQIGAQTMLEAVDGHNLIELSRCMQEKIFALKEWKDHPVLEAKLIKLGVIVDDVIISKLPTMVEAEEIIILNLNETRKKRYKKGWIAKCFGWLYPEEIYDLNLEKL